MQLGLPQYGAGSPDADPLHGRFGRVEDQAHAALGQGLAGERSPARHPRAAHRASAVAELSAQGGAVLQRRRQRRDGVDRRADDLRSAAGDARSASGRGRCSANSTCRPSSEPDMAAWSAVRREGEDTRTQKIEHRAGRQVHRTARRLQVDLRIASSTPGAVNDCKVKLRYVNSEKIDAARRRATKLGRMAGILVAPGLRQPRHRGEDRGRALRPRRTASRSWASAWACSAP